MKKLLSLAILGAALLTGQAYAACSNPTGTAGQTRYATNYSMMVFCDGTNWVSMAGGVSLTIGGTTNNYTISDTRIGAIGTNNQWCNTNGTVINCNNPAPLTGSGADGYVGYWLGGAVTGNSSFTYNQGTSTLTVTNLIGLITTAAQPNITSVGTLTGLTMGGNIMATGYNVSATNLFASSVSGSTGAFGALTVGGVAVGGGAQADRITSNTSAVIVSTTGEISFKNNGTIASYINGSGLYVTPGISATTNQTSVTTLYASGNVGIGTANPQELFEIAKSGGGARVAISDGGGASRKALLLQGPNPGYARILAYDYGSASGIPVVMQDTGGGSVGIGTTAPTSLLNLVSASGPTSGLRLGVGNSSGYYYDIYHQTITSGTINNALVINANGDVDYRQALATKSGSGRIVFMTAMGSALGGEGVSTERMRIDRNGKVGIGTTNPNAKLEVAGTVSATGITANGVPVMAGMFYKADPDSVAFTKTGAGTVSIKAGTVVQVGTYTVNYANATAVSMPSLTAGTDYAIYACGDGTAVADSNWTSTTSCTGGYRKIGGFHYAPGGNATAQAGGDTTPAINAYSLWDLHWRPKCDPRGMTLVANSFWVDIYLLNTDPDTYGTSAYNKTIADGGTSPTIPAMFGGNGSAKYNTLDWYAAAEMMKSQGKELLSQSEFMTAAYGTTENSSSGANPVTTGLSAAYTSKWGVMQSTGQMWVWSRDQSYRHDADTWNWHNVTGSRGQVYSQDSYGIVYGRFGGHWTHAGNSGSRASTWTYYPWASSVGVGARGRCDHVRLE